MNRTVLVVCSGLLPQMHELEERFGVVSVFILEMAGAHFCRELLVVGEILRDPPTVEMSSPHEAKNGVNVSGERRWGGRTTFHQSKGNLAEDKRRKVPWRRNARNR